MLQLPLDLPETTEAEADKVRDDLEGYAMACLPRFAGQGMAFQRAAPLDAAIDDSPGAGKSNEDPPGRYEMVQRSAHWKNTMQNAFYHQLMMISNSSDDTSLELKEAEYRL